MKYGELTWNAEKNRLLRETRGLSFEDIESAIEQKKVLADIPHPLEEKYPSQRLLVVLVNGYALNVPYVKTSEGIFLKTIFPSRKSQKLFLNRGNDE